MARLTSYERHHAGWPRRGIVAFALLVIVLWVTGFLLWQWNSADLAQLSPAELQGRNAARIVHGCGAWLFCALAGRWLWPHTTLVWRRAAQGTWWLGLLAGVLALAAAVTGLLVLYGPGNLQELAASVHWWSAVGWPALIAVHARRLVVK